MRDGRLPEEAARKGDRVLAQLRKLADRHESIGEVRGLGLMIGVELVADGASKEPAPALAARVRELCREAGVMVGVGGQTGNVVRFQPPLVISDLEIDRAVATLDQALEAARYT